MSGFRRRRIVAGLRADTVFFADSGPLILSGGRTYKVSLSTQGQGARISLDSPLGDATIADLASGGTDEMAKAYSDLCSDLRRQARPSGWRTFSLGAAVGAVIAASVFGAVSASIVAGAWRSANAPASVAAMPAGPAGMPSLSKIQELMPALDEIRKHTEAAKPVAVAPGAVPAEPEVPATVGIPLPDDVIKGPVSSDRFNPTATPGGLPPYIAPEQAEAPAVKPSIPAAAGHEEDAAKDSAAAGHDGNDGDAKAPKADDGAKAAAKAKPEKPAAPDPAVKDGEAAPKAAQDKKAEAAKPEEDAAAARDRAQAAAQALLKQGLTQGQAVDVLTKLEALGRVDPSKITPDMLAGLPHEVAKMLVDNGLVNSDDAPDGVNYSIIRVPETVIDAHRGPDGIADIPERNTWSSTGNYVSIPLPGGGDVKTPEDLEAFHLKP